MPHAAPPKRVRPAKTAQFVALAAIGAGLVSYLALRPPAREATERAFAPGTSGERERERGPEISLSLRLDQLARAKTDAARCAALQRLADGTLAGSGSSRIASYAHAPNTLEVQKCALHALGYAPGAEALGHLLALARGLEQNLRDTLAESLALRDEPDAREALLSLAREPRSVWRLPVVTALVELGAPEAAGLIVSLLADAELSLAVRLVEALGHTHDPNAVRVLAGLLKGSTRKFQLAVADTLSEIGSEEATRTLLELAAHTPSIASSVMYALGRSNDPSARSALSQAARRDDSASQYALQALQRFARDAELDAIMLAALQRDEPGSIGAAVDYFAQHSAPAATSRLIDLLKTGSAEICRRALSALARTGDPLASQTLEALALGDGRMKSHALVLLAAMGGDHRPRARALAREIVSAGGHDAEEVRYLLGSDSSP